MSFLSSIPQRWLTIYTRSEVIIQAPQSNEFSLNLKLEWFFDHSIRELLLILKAHNYLNTSKNKGNLLLRTVLRPTLPTDSPADLKFIAAKIPGAVTERKRPRERSEGSPDGGDESDADATCKLTTSPSLSLSSQLFEVGHHLNGKTPGPRDW